MEQGAAADDRPGRPRHGRPPRDVLLLLVGAAALVVAFWLLIRLRGLLVLLLISFFLSFALEPPANLLARRGWWRGLATATVFAVLVLGVMLFVAGVGSLVVDQLGDLVDAIPGYAQQVADFLNDRLGTEVSGGKLAEDVQGDQGVQDFVNGLAASAVGLSTTPGGAGAAGLHRRAVHLLPGRRRAPAAPDGLLGAAAGPPGGGAAGLGPGHREHRRLRLLPGPAGRRLGGDHQPVPGPDRGPIPARPRPLGRARLPVRPHRRHLPGRRPAGVLPAAASAQALVSIYLHRYEVIASPLTATPHPARRVP